MYFRKQNLLKIEGKNVDIATLIGIIIGIACILVTIVLEGNVLVY